MGSAVRFSLLATTSNSPFCHWPISPGAWTLNPPSNFTGPITGLAKKYELQEEVWVIKYGVGYDLGTWNLGKSEDSPNFSLIPWVGGFYFHDDWSLTIKPYGEPLSGKTTGTYDFNTPMVGLGSRVILSEKWYLNLSYYLIIV